MYKEFTLSYWWRILALIHLWLYPRAKKSMTSAKSLTLLNTRVFHK